MTSPQLTGRRNRRPEAADAQKVAEKVMNLIREDGGRATAARRVIIGALNDAASHRSAEELASQIHRDHPEISQSTIYRNLDRLEHLGVAYHTHLGHGPAQWHLTTDAGHHHLTCRSCGQVIDVDPSHFAGLQATMADQFGFTVDLGHFAITGTCRDCTP